MSRASLEPSRFRELPVAATGRTAPFALTAPAYAVACLGWTAAAIALALSAQELADGAVFEGGVVLAAHLVGLVFFPFAVASAVWQLLPVMLRNDPPTRRLRPLALLLLAAGAPLAAGIALETGSFALLAAALVALGLALLLGEVASLVRGAPTGKVLVVSRPAVVLAVSHAAIAFGLGVVALADDGPEPLGVTYERFLLIHLSVAVIGWLTVLIGAVGRTLLPMLGLAAAEGRRSAPLAEAGVVAGLWIYVAGLALPTDALVVVGIVVMVIGLSPLARTVARVALHGRIGVREGPVAHAMVGVVFMAEAAALGIAGALHEIDGRRAAIAAVVLLGLGWAAGVVVGHVGKLASLSGWGSWPPGPRPKQEALYPRRIWQVEVVVFAVGIEALAAGVAFESQTSATAGGAALVTAALLATLGIGDTARRVGLGKRPARP